LSRRGNAIALFHFVNRAASKPDSSPAKFPLPGFYCSCPARRANMTAVCDMDHLHAIGQIRNRFWLIFPDKVTAVSYKRRKQTPLEESTQHHGAADFNLQPPNRRGEMSQLPIFFPTESQHFTAHDPQMPPNPTTHASHPGLDRTSPHQPATQPSRKQNQPHQ